MTQMIAIPSLSQVRDWDTAHLTDAADRWSATARTWDSVFDQVASHMLRPGGAVWEGAAADAAQTRAYTNKLTAVGWADRLHDAADIARRGAAQIEHAKARVLDAVSAAESAGFTVREDFSVSSSPAVAPAEAAALRARARAFATDIRTSVGELVRIDHRVADEISYATGSFSSGSVQLVDFKRAPADGPLSPQEPGGGYGSYHYGYPFSTTEGWTTEQIMSEVQQHFNYYFTFTADTNSLVEGARLNLKGPFGEDEPVQVTSVTPDSFSFISLPGHNEGAGRIIKFTVVPAAESPVPGRLNWELRVAASGPLSKASLVPVTSLANKVIWQIFANNLDSRLPARPSPTRLAAS